MTTIPLIGVVVINLDGGSLLERFLRSCEELDYPAVKVYVVDNGSSDKGGTSRLRLRVPLRVIQLAANVGIEARNEGIKAALDAGAEYVFVTDNDTVLDSNCLSRLLLVMSQHPGFGIIAPLTHPVGEPDHVESLGGYVDWRTCRVRAAHKRILSVSVSKLVWEVDCVGAALIRRQVFENIGLYDPAYFAYSEDVDFCTRALRAGFRVGMSSVARIWHHGSATISRIGGFKSFFFVRNSFILRRKFCKAKVDASFLLGVLETAAFGIAAEILRGKTPSRFLAPAFAFWGLITGFSYLMTGREWDPLGVKERLGRAIVVQGKG